MCWVRLKCMRRSRIVCASIFRSKTRFWSGIKMFVHFKHKKTFINLLQSIAQFSDWILLQTILHIHTFYNSAIWLVFQKSHPLLERVLFFPFLNEQNLSKNLFGLFSLSSRPIWTTFLDIIYAGFLCVLWSLKLTVYMHKLMRGMHGTIIGFS